MPKKTLKLPILVGDTVVVSKQPIPDIKKVKVLFESKTLQDDDSVLYVNYQRRVNDK
jgi:hypothetical protein